MEEPQIHLLAARGVVDKIINPEYMLEVFNNTVRGLRAKTEVWCHTCWGNPSQQRMFAQVQSYKPALKILNKVDADVITFESCSSGGMDLEAIGREITDMKVAIGVIDHHSLQVETPTEVANHIRMALKHIPVERLVLSSDCGMGREGMARRHALYKMVSLVQGTNIVRKEHGINEAECIAADANLTLLDVKRTPASAGRAGEEVRQSGEAGQGRYAVEEEGQEVTVDARHRLKRRWRLSFVVPGCPSAPQSAAIRGNSGRTVLAVGILHRDLAVSKRQEIAAVHFHASAVEPCSRERPLGHASVAVDEVPRISPMGIGERRKDLGEPRAHGLSSGIASAADAPNLAEASKTQSSHERHERVDVWRFHASAKACKTSIVTPAISAS